MQLFPSDVVEALRLGQLSETPLQGMFRMRGLAQYNASPPYTHSNKKPVTTGRRKCKPIVP